MESALYRNLEAEGYVNLLTRSRASLDLTRQSDVEVFFNREHPEYVFLAAAKVGGIWANNAYPAEFIYSNLVIQSNIIQAASIAGVKRLIFLGSSCIYPRNCPQPMKFDTTKPDGTPQKLLDVTRLDQLGWKPRIGLKQGIEQTYAWYERQVRKEVTEQGIMAAQLQ